MRFARFLHQGRAGLGLLAGEDLLRVPGVDDLLPLLRRDGGLAEAAAAAGAAGDGVGLAEVELLAPLACPPTVRDFYAFEAHVVTSRAARGLAMEPAWYEQPVFYFSNPYAVRGPGELRLPAGTARFDFELEVAAVVGRAGQDVDVADADDHIAGYCVLNDWSARDVQAAEMRVGLGPAKGKDAATGLGPWFVTTDEIEHRRRAKGFDLAMTASVNGVPYSAGCWSDLHWSFAEMVAHASAGTEVRPGDVLGSGTCGTGCILELSAVHGEEAYPWLRRGDVVVVSVEMLGSHEVLLV